MRGAADIASPLNPLVAAIKGITHTGSLIDAAVTGLWDSPAGLSAASDLLGQLNAGLAAVASGARAKRRAGSVDQTLRLHVSTGVSPEDAKARQERRKVLGYMPYR
jgi:hypothetical protein